MAKRLCGQASGLAQLCNGASMPPGLSELVCSQQALAAVGLALLRQQRTQQGQLVQLSRHLCGLFCHSLAALEPPEPLQSPLLQTLDGRFLRLLGKGHQPYEAYVLLHALGQRESLAQHVGGTLAINNIIGSGTLRSTVGRCVCMIRCAYSTFHTTCSYTPCIYIAV